MAFAPVVLVALTQASVVRIWPVVAYRIVLVVVFARNPVPLIPVAATVAHRNIVILVVSNPLQNDFVIWNVRQIHLKQV
jgi:hypothetical protein